nr:MAG TPA: hypothetical protein [Caudoviricetes sp.]
MPIQAISRPIEANCGFHGQIVRANERKPSKGRK